MLTWIKILLIISLVISVLYILSIVTSFDRRIRLSFTSPNEISTKIRPISEQKQKRIVIIFTLPPSVATVKSLLDQSVKVDDIALETEHPENISDELKQLVSVHYKGTAPIRECESDTMIIVLNDYDKIYDYDFVERRVVDEERRRRRSI